MTHVGHRRRGYAKAVLLKALEDAWAANCYKVLVYYSERGQRNHLDWGKTEHQGLNLLQLFLRDGFRQL